MKIVYIGSPSFSATLLKKLVNDSKTHGFSIPLVITQPDQPVGRKKIITPTAVKTVAIENNIPVSFELEVIRTIQPDLVVLFAYGKIIPQWALDIPTFGFWNIHPSLLPMYRGASPVSYPLLLGNTTTGTTLMEMDAELDHGDIIQQQTFTVKNNHIQTSLLSELSELSYTLLISNIKKVLKSGKKPFGEKQNHSLATYTRPLEKKDGYIPFSLLKAAFDNKTVTYYELPFIIQDWYKRNNKEPNQKVWDAKEVVCNIFRALHGWPGIWTTVSIKKSEKRLKILSIDYTSVHFSIKEVQLEGKTPIDFSTFNTSYSLL